MKTPHEATNSILLCGHLMSVGFLTVIAAVILIDLLAQEFKKIWNLRQSGEFSEQSIKSIRGKQDTSVYLTLMLSGYGLL